MSQGDAELKKVGLADPYAEHKRKPLAEHLDDYRATLEAKGDTPEHVKRTAGRVRALLNGCGFVFPADADAGRAAFVSAGGYHHHIGLNTWESLGGSPPPPGTTGLYHTAIVYLRSNSSSSSTSEGMLMSGVRPSAGITSVCGGSDRIGATAFLAEGCNHEPKEIDVLHDKLGGRADRPCGGSGSRFRRRASG